MLRLEAHLPQYGAVVFHVPRARPMRSLFVEMRQCYLAAELARGIDYKSVQEDFQVCLSLIHI